MELIPVASREVGHEQVQTVNARELHGFLEVGKVFGAWITERIEQFGFIEHQDFEVFSDSGNNPRGGRPAKEYAVTLDMAKELAMLERNYQGKQARLYFIECERRVKAAPARPAELTRMELIQLAMQAETEKLVLEAKVQEQAPKVAALDRIATADGSMCVSDAAKTLDLRPKDLFSWLSQHKWIYRRPGKTTWTAYQSRLQSGVGRLRSLMKTDEAFRST